MFKNQLKAFLYERRVTAAELARRTGVPKQTISDWLSGTRPRDMECVRRVAHALDVAITELLFGMPVAEASDGEVAESRERPVESTLVQRYCDFFFDNAVALHRILDLRTGYPNALSLNWEKATGWSRSDLMKRQWLDLVHPEDRPQLASFAQSNAFTHAPLLACEHRLLHANGRYLRIHTKFAIDSAAHIMTSISLPLKLHIALSEAESPDFKGAKV